MEVCKSVFPQLVNYNLVVSRLVTVEKPEMKYGGKTATRVLMARINVILAA